MGILKIYKASAGSGKTHRLTQEYINLIMSSSDSYRHILAVTFTNKATAEMKSRILQELFKKSQSDPQINQRLISILHDYSSFNISTIDKFFQSTLRAFARESNLNSSYGVELDDNMVISEAVDRVINSLDLPENQELLEWFINFTLSTADEGKSWDIRREIEKKIDNFTRESFKIIRRELITNVNRSFLSDFIKEIDHIIESFESQMKSLAAEAERILERNNLVFENFKNGSKTPLKYFTKLDQGKIEPWPDTFAALADNFDNWVRRNLSREQPALYNSIENAYYDGLNGLVRDIVNNTGDFRVYRTALAVKGEIYILGILIEIQQQIQQFSKEKNILLLSETNDLLNRIINGDDAPFIYEKVGSRIDNFLLDEFQDTSRMQWDNFKPLIGNSLAQGNMNLLVGDVKQSIYRWRGSDWRILNEGVDNSFPGASTEIKTLDENWRSGDEIVDFNNAFFPFASEQCDRLLGDDSSLVSSVYSGSEQKQAGETKVKKGHVSVKFIREENAVKWQEVVLDELAPLLKNLKENGFKLRDITFLVRRNDEGTKIAGWLIENGYPVISEDSLLLNLSPAVKKFIAILKFFNNPTDPVNNALLELIEVEPEFNSEIIQLPLYQMCETVQIQYLGQENKTQSAYLISLLDNVLEFSRTASPDLNSFIEWYEANGNKLSLPSPSDQDAVRVMTIHKAKGLSLEAVIVPFMELKLQESNRESNNYIWCKAEQEPFSRIPYLPARKTKELLNTCFAQDYNRERGISFVDNLNLAYVAFTRARRELHIFAPAPKENGNRDGQPSVARLLNNFLKESVNADGSWERGEWCRRDADIDNKNKRERDDEIVLAASAALPGSQRLRLKYSYGEIMDENSHRNSGIIMHTIMSRIVHRDDIEKVVSSYIGKGIIREYDLRPICATLQEYMESVDERHWFDGSYKVYNERDIIEPSSFASRPDRIMTGEKITIIVDYKFGLKKDNSHINQMKRYLRLTSLIRKGKIEGYLWYPLLKEVIQVKNS